MASFESIQRRIDTRYLHAQKNLETIALNNQGAPEDMARFVDALRKVAVANFSINEQTRFKHSLTKSIIDAVQ